MFRNMLNTLVKLYQLFAQIKQTTMEDVCGRVEFIQMYMYMQYTDAHLLLYIDYIKKYSIYDTQKLYTKTMN